jgi:hypothetical protein
LADRATKVQRQAPHLTTAQRLKRLEFAAHYATTGNLTLSAQAVGISRQSHYLWLESDPEYATAFAEADAKACDLLEAEARRRAIEGLPKYKFHEGKPVLHPETGEPYYERDYSDTLLIFLLKGLRPDKYRDAPPQLINAQQTVINVTVDD